MQNRVSRYYEFAGIKIVFSAPELPEWNRLAKFRTEPQKADITYDVHLKNSIKSEDAFFQCIDQGCEIYVKDKCRVRILRHDKTKEIVMMDTEERSGYHKVFLSDRYPEAWGGALMMKILDLPRQMILHKGIFLHASFIIRDNKAILFSGPKQVGKSTQAELWRKGKNAVIANGDRVILKKMNGAWYAWGSPYSGTSDICENVVHKIRCIVILSQGKENIAYRATEKEAFFSLMENCSYEVRDRKQLELTLQIIEEIVSETEFIKFSCTPDFSSVKALEDYLWQSQK